MNKSTITRERAEQLANFKGAPVTRQEEQELARIALAAMDSEPVGEFYEDGPLNWYQISDGDRVPAHRRIPLYRHAQPAPVVPVEMNSDKAWGELKISAEDCQAWSEGWNACRAAMLDNCATVESRNNAGCSPKNGLKCATVLQAEPVKTANKLPETQFKQVADLYEMQFDDGRTCAFHTDAEKAVQWLNTCDGNKVQEYVKLERLHDAVSGNSPVIPDTWIPVSERMPQSRYEVLVGRWWGEKPRWRCKWATYIPGHPDSQSSGWLIPGASWIPTHWMPLPAAPQEVK